MKIVLIRPDVPLEPVHANQAPAGLCEFSKISIHRLRRMPEKLRRPVRDKQRGNATLSGQRNAVVRRAVETPVTLTLRAGYG
jgi:hypothetical protein